MTRMLYIDDVMNTLTKDKLNTPEEWGTYSWKSGSHWLALLFLTDVPGAYMIANHKDWPLMATIPISLLPLAAGVLYAHSIARWIRGMDEMHRQITVSAFALAMVIYLALGQVWTLLADRAEIMERVFHLSRLGVLERMPFPELTFMVCMLTVLFKVAYAYIYNRRYK
jgi:predicted Na+-dependent transporter